MINRFNIRVYGILITSDHKLLVSDEVIAGRAITKFCGGGLEFGEGTIACLKREFLEEMNLPIDVDRHFYTTDIFQQSAFKDTDQILSIYYRVTAKKNIAEVLSVKNTGRFTGQNEIFEGIESNQNFRLIPVASLLTSDFTLPLDKFVADMIIRELEAS